MTAVSEYEFHIDSCIQLFLSRIRDITQHQSATIDMSAWLQYYAFDTLGQINFSRKLGFLATGQDVGGICELDHKQMMYFALVRSRGSEPNASFHADADDDRWAKSPYSSESGQCYSRGLERGSLIHYSRWIIDGDDAKAWHCWRFFLTIVHP